MQTKCFERFMTGKSIIHNAIKPSVIEGILSVYYLPFSPFLLRYVISWKYILKIYWCLRIYFPKTKNILSPHIKIIYYISIVKKGSEFSLPFIFNFLLHIQSPLLSFHLWIQYLYLQYQVNRNIKTASQVHYFQSIQNAFHEQSRHDKYFRI